MLSWPATGTTRMVVTTGEVAAADAKEVEAIRIGAD
jgi:hypothetical protein